MLPEQPGAILEYRVRGETIAPDNLLVPDPTDRRYAGALSCARCFNRAVCVKCGGPMRERQRGVPECALCGHTPVRWSCPHCHTGGLRTPLPGAARTAEELAKAFPGVLALNSSADRIRDGAPDEPAIVVSTPGAEPVAPTGYAGVLILDAEVALNRAELRAPEESVRRWANAAALARGPREGGSVLIVGPSPHPAVQAMVRADLAGFASRELEDRAEAGLSPAVKLARIVGEPEGVREFLDNDDWEGVDILGPTEVGPERWAALLRVPVERARDLTVRVKSAAAIRSRPVRCVPSQSARNRSASVPFHQAPFSCPSSCLARVRI